MTNKDWKGNDKSTYITIGASNHTDKIREEHDFYATDPIAINVLLEEGKEVFNHKIWKCSCGSGCLSERLKKYGYDVKSSDLINRGYGVGGVDFLQTKGHWDGDIITNPPYSLAIEFIQHALDLIDDGQKVAMFLKLSFLEGKGRKQFFLNNPPKYLYVSSSRILCAKNAEFDKMKAAGGSAVAYGWYVWVKGFKGNTEIKWIN